MSPRTLVILITLLPMIATTGAYLLSAFSGHVPWCIPNIDGCTTISRAARSGDAIYFFRPLMIIYSVLLLCFWLYTKHWLTLLHGHTKTVTHVLFWLGSSAAAALLIYIDFLGTTGEVNRFMRRFGILIYFTLTPLAQLLLLQQHYKLLNISPALSKQLKVLQYQLVVILLMLGTGIVSILLNITNNKTYATENIIEWNFALLLTLYFSGMLYIWKGYRANFIINSGKN